VSGILQAGAGVLSTLSGSGSGAAGGSGDGDSGEFQAPPLVLGYVGDRPRSFPLQMRHSGRCVWFSLLQQHVLGGRGGHT